MGYTTDFFGRISIEPPLNEHEVSYLNDFNNSRRMKRTGGPYVADPGDDRGQYGILMGGTGRQPKDEIIDHNGPPEGQPGLWCQWQATDDGKFIEWDGGEKFYHSPEWMAYIINHFLRDGAEASKTDRFGRGKPDPRFEHFTFDHVLNGAIEAEGEDPNDRWMLVVEGNEVSVREAKPVEYGDSRPIG